MGGHSDKRGGLRWFVHRIRKEFYAPTRVWSAGIVNAFLDARAGITRRFKSRMANPIAVYDLRICANTFDFAYFLYDAETYFRGLGFDRFQVCILDTEQFDPGEYGNVIDWNKRRKRVKAMLVPMAEMYQGCSSVRVLSDAEELVTLCDHNEPIFPRRVDGRHLRTFRYAEIYRKMAQQLPYSGFKAPPAAIEKVLQFKQHHGVTKPSVTLTVRAYTYQPLRNTDMEVYFRFADHLRSIGFEPIFIPDTEAPKAVGFRDFLSFEDACSDLYLRTAMYEASFTNIFTSNGVHAMAAFGNKSSCILTLLNENYESNTGMKRWESEGLRFGDQPFGGTTKHFIWARESFDALKTYFEIVRHHRPVSAEVAPKIELRKLSCDS